MHGEVTLNRDSFLGLPSASARNTLVNARLICLGARPRSDPSAFPLQALFMHVGSDAIVYLLSPSKQSPLHADYRDMVDSKLAVEAASLCFCPTKIQHLL